MIKIIFKAFLLFSFYFINLLENVSAHEIKPAVVEFNQFNNQIDLTLKFNAESFLANIDASIHKETKESPNSNLYDEMRLLSSKKLKEKILNSADKIQNSIFLKTSDKALNLKLVDIVILEEKNIEKVRYTEILFESEIQNLKNSVTFETEKSLGPIIFRDFSNVLGNKEKPKSQWLQAGAKTNPININIDEVDYTNLIISAVWSGILHIIPYGFDHILFVLGLFFFSYKIKPLLIQVTTFTVAHSITLILGSLGYVSISSSIIESFIAASIIWIGVENLFRRNMNFSRTSVIFCFGLLHGLGFATMFKQIGLEGSDYFLNLLSFNIGIEIGQIATLLPLIFLIPIFNRISWYRMLIAIPASVIIALFGANMFIDRVL